MLHRLWNISRWLVGCDNRHRISRIKIALVTFSHVDFKLCSGFKCLWFMRFGCTTPSQHMFLAHVLEPVLAMFIELILVSALFEKAYIWMEIVLDVLTDKSARKSKTRGVYALPSPTVHSLIT
jgi:hypothetical protein